VNEDDTKPSKPRWGPWSPLVVGRPHERVAQLRCLRTLVHVFIGSRKAPGYSDSIKYLEEALHRSESVVRLYGELADNDSGPLADARILFDALPAARQRDIIATFAVLHKPLAPEREE
jgi:hypothetical protein